MTPTLTDCNLPLLMPYQPMRMSIEQYHHLIDTGMFVTNERFELLEGVVVEKMTKNPPSQDLITLADSEPEPDLAVIRGSFEDYGKRHPRSDDVGLVIEISDASLVTDRYKASIYAAAGIPFYLIVNL